MGVWTIRVAWRIRTKNADVIQNPQQTLKKGKAIRQQPQIEGTSGASARNRMILELCNFNDYLVRVKRTMNEG